VIKSEAEYAAALKEIEALWDAAPGTPEAETAELWTALIDHYEKAVYPTEAPDPVSAIRFRMEQQNLKPADLIPYLGSKSRVSEVLAGRRPLSLSMIRRFHEGLGIPAEVLLGELPRRLSPALSGTDWRSFPLAEMVRRRWFGDAIRSTRDLLERAEDVLGPLVAPVLAEPAPAASLRQKIRTGSLADENALLAWKARVWHLAERQRVAPYNPKAITKSFIGEVARLSPLKDGPTVAVDYLAKAGIRVVVEPRLPRTHLDGAAMRIAGRPPVVALTLRYDRLDHFWFTLCHELAHVALHLQRDQGGAFVDDLEAPNDSAREREADRVAANAMIPEAEWKSFRGQGAPSREDVMDFAASLRVHPAIVAGRIRKETKNYRLFSGLIGNRKLRVLFARPEGRLAGEPDD
jgi:HTH-type transcriptional regulator/antitoxin HigA